MLALMRVQMYSRGTGWAVCARWTVPVNKPGLRLRDFAPVPALVYELDSCAYSSSGGGCGDLRSGCWMLGIALGIPMRV